MADQPRHIARTERPFAATVRARAAKAVGAIERRYWWGIALLTVLALAVRVPTLGTQSFTGDEQVTAWHVQLSLRDLLANVADWEATPYLYFVLVKLWAEVFGSSEAGLRSLSLVAGVATVPVAALVAQELLSRRAALLTGLLVATNPLLVWFSQDARAYALFALFAALALLFFARALTELRPRTVTLWAVWSALALLTHYYAVFWIVPQAAWLLLLERRGQRARHMVVVAVTVLGLVGAALVPLAQHQRSVPGLNPGGLAGVPLASRVKIIPREFLLGPPQPCLRPRGTRCTGSDRSFGLAALLALVTVLPLIRVRDRRWWRGVAAGGGLVGASAVLVPVVLAVGGFDSLTVRNVISGVVPLALVLAAAAATDWRAALAALALSAIGLVAIGSVVAHPWLQRGDLRGVAARAGLPSAERAIVASPGQPLGAFAIYWPGSTQMLPDDSASVREVLVYDLDGAPAAGSPPLRPLPVPSAFRLVQRARESDYTLLRFRAAGPQRVSFSRLLAFTDLPFRRITTKRPIGIYLQR